ncbi:hypothetical protein [Desulfonatronum lacustre]|nr:hypothetical protein [Desulfonatronum lacustre]SMP73697.1 hypothetical protein SAMN06295888_12143 [Desulfonatronum zhilinae]
MNIQNKRQMDQLELEYSEGKITEEEYNSRKEQIQRGSIILTKTKEEIL